MITQETRERMDNLIRCIQAKLEGKTIEWFDTVKEQWRAFGEDDWCFMSTSQLRIAPELEQKLQRWTVMDPSGSSVTCDTLEHAKNLASADSLIIELTETARIEPKKREPRRIWHNRYGGQWGMFAFTSANSAREEAATGKSDPTEIAVEFVEVVK